VLRETTSRGLCGLVCPKLAVSVCFYYCSTCYKAVRVGCVGMHQNFVRRIKKNLKNTWLFGSPNRSPCCTSFRCASCSPPPGEPQHRAARVQAQSDARAPHASSADGGACCPRSLHTRAHGAVLAYSDCRHQASPVPAASPRRRVKLAWPVWGRGVDVRQSLHARRLVPHPAGTLAG
jgi:hypothetical protein